MTARSTAKNLSDFSSIEWAASYLSSPDWIRRERDRGPDAILDADHFCRDTMRAHDGVQHWLEMYPRPAPGARNVPRSISLFKFGTGLTGFAGIMHGGAIMALVDEALGFLTVVNEKESGGSWAETQEPKWLKKFEAGRPFEEVMEGYFVTAKVDMKFLKPVLCPGVVGIEAEMLENKGHRLKIRAIMKNAKGVPLVQADSVWIRLGGMPKGKL